MIPSRSRKTIGGWTNHPCTVTSHKMIEKEMGNRGSKSGFSNPVKEQRVDGSRCIAKTLFYAFKVYSNGFRKKLSNQNPF